jgi:lysozyme
MLLINLRKSTPLIKFFLLIPFVWLASKWEREGDHWCTHQTLSLIAEFEGFFPKTYLCPAGYPTIGYGHLLLDHERFLIDAELTRHQAIELLRSDLIFAYDIRPYLSDPDRLEPHQLDALTSLTYNLGYPEISRSLLVKHINENKIEAAYDFFAPWRGINDKVIAGLVKRRLAELMVFANRAFDPESDLLPSEQWGIPLKHTDENWKILKKIDAKSGSELLEEAVQIFYAYQSRKGKVYDMSR